MTRTRLVAASALDLAGAAVAQDCAKANTQTDMNVCAGRALTRADARLNATYRAYSAKLSPASRAGPQTAQRSWIAFRDADGAL